MQAEGVKLTRKVAETLLSALGRSGLVAEAERLWRSMVWGRATLRPDRRSFLTAVRVFRECGALSQALHAYNGMRRSGALPGPSRHWH
jgi:pentatricopeptide repeat protein